jgi:hypothetical protein
MYFIGGFNDSLRGKVFRPRVVGEKCPAGGGFEILGGRIGM